MSSVFMNAYTVLESSSATPMSMMLNMVRPKTNIDMPLMQFEGVSFSLRFALVACLKVPIRAWDVCALSVCGLI